MTSYVNKLTLVMNLVGHSDSLTRTPENRLSWCRCRMSRAPHLLSAQLKERKKTNICSVRIISQTGIFLYKRDYIKNLNPNFSLLT